MIEDQRGPAQHQTEADLRAVLDNMTDVFFRTDPEGRLQMASRSIETLLGWPRAELLGRPVQNHYVDLDQRDSFIHLTDAQGGRASGVELELRRADGGSVWVSASARRLSGTCTTAARVATGRSTTTVTAPRSTASPTKSCPSALTPRMATNTPPGRTSCER